MRINSRRITFGLAGLLSLGLPAGAGAGEYYGAGRHHSHFGYGPVAHGYDDQGPIGQRMGYQGDGSVDHGDAGIDGGLAAGLGLGAGLRAGIGSSLEIGGGDLGGGYGEGYGGGLPAGYATVPRRPLGPTLSPPRYIPR